MKYQWSRPNQHHPHGVLVEFVCAPPRFPGEPPREPPDLLGKVGTILDGPAPESHGWGGLFNVLVAGRIIASFGDFMKVVNESR